MSADLFTSLQKHVRRSRIPLAAVGTSSLVSLALLAATPRKARWSTLTLFWRGIWLSLWSRHLRNMILSSLLTSYVLSKRFKASLGLPLSFGTLYMLYYHFAVKEFAKVQCQATYWNTLIVERAGLSKQPFCPTFWAIGRHAQTTTCLVIGMLEWLWCEPVNYVREYVRGWDGNEQHLDWVDEVLSAEREASAARRGVQSKPIVLLIHGLGDDRFHPAVLRMARICKNRGWRPVVWSYWRLDFSETRDLQDVLEHISSKAPSCPIAAIGWSAGGHLLLNYLGVVGKASPLVCAVTLSAAVDLHCHGQSIVEEENAFYYRFLGIMAQKCVRRHVNNDKRIQDPQKFLKNFPFYELDGRKLYNSFLTSCPSDSSLSTAGTGSSEQGRRHHEIGQKTFSERRRACVANCERTGPLTRQMMGSSGGTTSPPAVDSEQLSPEAGYPLLEKYPAAAKHLAGISIPTLFIRAQDDPVTRLHKEHEEDLESNRHVIRVTTGRGGHMGHYDGLFPAGTTWDARTAAAFIGAVLETLSATHYTLNILKEAQLQGLLAEPSGVGGRSPSASSGPKVPSFPPAIMRRICSESDVRALPP